MGSRVKIVEISFKEIHRVNTFTDVQNSERRLPFAFIFNFFFKPELLLQLLSFSWLWILTLDPVPIPAFHLPANTKALGTTSLFLPLSGMKYCRLRLVWDDDYT